MRVEVKCPYKLAKANPTDAGWDLYPLEDLVFEPGEVKMVDTGCQIKILQEWGLPFFNIGMPNDRGGAPMDIPCGRGYTPETKFGLEVQVRGRSSMAKKGFITHMGTVDETYHSPIKVVLMYFGREKITLPKENAIAQLVFSTFIPVETIEVKEMEENRGGFGSSNKS